jgi:transposase
MSLEEVGAAMIIEGSTTQKVFEAYASEVEVLAPTLKPGQMIIVDNLSAHKSEKVKPLIESRAASVIFWPAYSPDFNPIEETFSKIKAIRKKTAAVPARHSSGR